MNASNTPFRNFQVSFEAYAHHVGDEERKIQTKVKFVKGLLTKYQKDNPRYQNSNTAIRYTESILKIKYSQHTARGSWTTPLVN